MGMNNMKQLRNAALTTFLVLSSFCVMNCVFAITGYGQLWRFQWPSVFGVMILAAMGCGLELASKTE